MNARPMGRAQGALRALRRLAAATAGAERREREPGPSLAVVATGDSLLGTG